MPLRLALALMFSLAVHGALLLPGGLKRAPAAARPTLQASLHMPAPQPSPTPPMEPLLKNTLDEETPGKILESRPASAPPSSARKSSRRDVEFAQQKLSENTFYPEQAVAQGLEGEVRVILQLAPDGTVEKVSIAASSGYPLLDNAAIKAAYALGRLPGLRSRELILPVIFQLQ